MYLKLEDLNWKIQIHFNLINQVSNILIKKLINNCENWNNYGKKTKFHNDTSYISRILIK